MDVHTPYTKVLVLDKIYNFVFKTLIYLRSFRVCTTNLRVHDYNVIPVCSRIGSLHHYSMHVDNCFKCAELMSSRHR